MINHLTITSRGAFKLHAVLRFIDCTGRAVATKECCWLHDPKASPPRSWVVQIRGNALVSNSTAVEIGPPHLECRLEIRNQGEATRAITFMVVPATEWIARAQANPAMDHGLLSFLLGDAGLTVLKHPIYLAGKSSVARRA